MDDERHFSIAHVQYMSVQMVFDNPVCTTCIRFYQAANVGQWADIGKYHMDRCGVKRQTEMHNTAGQQQGHDGPSRSDGNCCLVHGR